LGAHASCVRYAGILPANISLGSARILRAARRHPAGQYFTWERTHPACGTPASCRQYFEGADN